jgi:hypothetical protein
VCLSVGSAQDTIASTLEFLSTQAVFQGPRAFLSSTIAGVDGGIQPAAADTGSISGTVFIDLNGNGVRDTTPTTEPGLSSNTFAVSIYLDLNGNGVFDAGDASTTTDTSGAYSFSGLADGDYTIRQIDPSSTSYVRTSAASLAAGVAAGGAVTGQDFGDWPTTYTGSAASDLYVIRLDAQNSARLQVLETISGNTVTHSIDKTLVPALRMTPGFGDDTFLIDYSNGNPVPPGGINIDAASQSTGAGDRVTVTGSAGADAIVISSLDSSSGNGSIAIKNIERVTVNGNGADDSLTLAPQLGIIESAFDGGAGSDSLTVSGSDAADTITLNSGSIVNGVWTGSFSGIESLSFDALGGNDTFNVAAASVPMTLAGGDGNDVLNLNAAPVAALLFNGGTAAGFDDTFNLNTGTYAFASDARAGTSSLALNLAAGTSAVFNSTQHLHALSIGSDALVTLAAGADKVLVTDGLTIAGSTDQWTGKFDLNDNDLILHSTSAARFDAAAQAANQIKQGFNLSGTFWAGNGITSSLGGDASSNLTAVGIILDDRATAAQPAGPLYTVFSNEPVGVNDVLVKFTYFGDADLDGQVTTNDYFLLDNAFLARRKDGWINGDFDYAGGINTNDYFAIDNAFIGQGGRM